MAKKKSKFWSSGKDIAKTRYSSYWLSDSRGISDYKSILSSTGGDSDLSPKHDIYALAESQEAISNFVRILTQRNDILVKYKSSTRDENYTDGKSVVISPNLEGDEFDVAVGLALHEASHIMYTDFTKLQYHVGSKDYWRSSVGEAEKRGLDVMKFKAVWNCIEDFYIDSVTYKTAPGYRGYYQALYQKYFGLDVIEKGLNSTDFSALDWNSYLFHLCNIRHPKRNLNALDGMNEIWDTIDLKNISRLENPEDRFDLTYKIYDIIDRNIPKQNQNQSNGTDDESEQPQQQDSESTGNGDDFDESNDFFDGSDGEGNGQAQELDLNNLSPTVKKRLDNILQKQLKYFDGDVSKGKIAKADSEAITNIQQMDGSIRLVAKSNESTESNEFSTPTGVRVLVIRNMNEALIKQGHYSKYGISKNDDPRGWGYESSRIPIETGMMRGRALAKKLQIRNEERITKTTRLASGNIDRRLLSELGFDNGRIFSKLNIVTYKPVHIHISIDQSSSMCGSRFSKSMEVATALATASLGIKNLNVVISLRGMDDATPYILYLFDSRKHNIAYIRNMFPRAYPHGCTPEGLTFEAIEKEIKKDALQNESYFINICDGQPACSVKGLSKDKKVLWFNYDGIKAQKHCKKQMLKMESHGVKYIAYLLTDSYNSYSDKHAIQSVQNCYADRMVVLNGAHEIEKISRSLNKKLLEVF
jgi:hypothetical protein